MAANISSGGSFFALRLEGVECSRLSLERARLLWRAASELRCLDLPLGVGLWSFERRRSLERCRDVALSMLLDLVFTSMSQRGFLRRFNEAGDSFPGPVKVARSRSARPLSRRFRGEAVSSLNEPFGLAPRAAVENELAHF